MLSVSEAQLPVEYSKQKKLQKESVASNLGKFFRKLNDCNYDYKDTKSQTAKKDLEMI